jgi:hypothetical protein
MQSKGNPPARVARSVPDCQALKQSVTLWRLPCDGAKPASGVTYRHHGSLTLFVSRWRDSAWLRCSLLLPQACNFKEDGLWHAKIKTIQRANHFSLHPAIVSHRVTVTLPLLFMSIRLERVRPIAQQSERF